jgi:hypothetical protein
MMIVNYSKHNDHLIIEMLYGHGDSIDIKKSVCAFLSLVTDSSDFVELVVY